jgi:hypothetical protein
VRQTKSYDMNFLDRFTNGWTITLHSFKVLKANKELIIFPILSGISLLFILGSFVTVLLAGAGWDIDNVYIGEEESSGVISYLLVFLYYLVNYFIVVFFNTALIHCTRLYFRGEEVTIKKGLQFSMSRIGSIAAWALFAATVGTILKVLQENLGWIGKIITGLIGIVWSIATFFVVPVLAYENVGPFGAFKRSSQLMRAKWGESLGATFSFALIQFIASLLIITVAFIVGSTIHPIAGIVIGVFGLLAIATIMSASQTIFNSAVYHNMMSDPIKHFDQQLLDGLFVKK